MTVAKIYKGVACLEINSKDGGKWWYQGMSLAYTPILIEEIKVLKTGHLQGVGNRLIVATPLHFDGMERLVALNLPRTDIVELKARGLWPKDINPPHESTDYTPWPAYTGGNKKAISLA